MKLAHPLLLQQMRASDISRTKFHAVDDDQPWLGTSAVKMKQDKSLTSQLCSPIGSSPDLLDW